MRVAPLVLLAWAHPHLRGEHGAVEMVTKSAPGLIPTCVGNTGSRGGPGFPAQAHPHLRGEHLIRRELHACF